MKPLLVLIIAFAITLAATRIINGAFEFALAGRIAMSVMLLFTAIGHFAYTKGMAMMVPKVIPYKTFIVYLTGMMEIVAAIGLLIPDFVKITAWLLIAFFVTTLPANIYAAINRIDYQKASNSSNGPSYLWFRIPLQIFFIGWTYLSAIKC
jgi:uncharacterized membrane protein